MGTKDQNPWLSIPAADYEAHMGSTGARQLELLSNVFRDLLAKFHPKTLAILGCATGNGLEHIQSDSIERLIAIEINPEYADIARQRFGTNIPNVEFIETDIADVELEPQSLDFISCGLFLEHVDPSVVLPKAKVWLKPGGILSTVLQLPIATGNTVSDTGIDSLKVLEHFAKLVNPADLTTMAVQMGFTLIELDVETLETGKSFCVVVYRLGQ